MGLALPAYAELRPVPDAGDDDGLVKFISNDPEFPGRADELREGVAYSFARSMDFRAGSYSGYNAWRDELAKLAGYPKAACTTQATSRRRSCTPLAAWEATEGSFWELIHFSDCDGTLGASVAAKLSRDFEEYQAKADAHPDKWFRDLYRTWRSAFNMAAQGGAVDFH